MTQTEQWLQKGLGVMAIILVLASSYAFAKITWLLISPSSALPASRAPVIDVQDLRQSNKPREVADVRAFTRWTLFGDEPRQTAAPQRAPQQVKAPETKLNLALLGVFVADVAENSTAIIGEARGRGEAKRYTIGERLPGNATLEGVYADHILLRRSGRVEKLGFPKDSTDGISVSGGSSASSDSGARGEAAARRSSVRRPSSSSRPGSRPDTASNRPAVRALGKQPPNPEQLGADPSEGASGANNNPLFSGLQNQTEATIKQLGLSTVDPSEGGGYLITESAPRQLLNMLPVSVGDRILSVNGQTLGDPAQDQALFQQVLNQESIQVELQKGDTRLTVDINLSDIMGGRR